ncbi:bactofilin family protein [Woodsholea maritima]|uniref:hypothetical protein n=1 Tax=Woodsholea maritima TaxID=240237 RepID=UPI00039A04D1|nr:hypothetical protein [Woodsholea maritima]
MSALIKIITHKLFLALMVAGLISAGASAQYIGGDMNLNLDEDDDVLIVAGDLTLRGRIGGDVEVFAGDADIDAAIEGDLEIAAGDMRISGSVGGDVHAAGADVSFNSNVTGNLDVAGADVTISGVIGQDLSVAGAMVQIDPSTVVGRDLEVGAREAIIQGEVAGRSKVRAREITLGGTFHGDVDLRSDVLFLEEGTIIEGALLVKGPKEPDVPTSVTIMGDVVYQFADNHGEDWEDFDGVDVDLDFFPGVWFLGSMFSSSAFVLGLLAALIAPKSTAHITANFMRRPWVSTLTGMVVFAFSPMMLFLLVLFLAITIIGIPLAVIVALAYVPVMFLAYAFGAMAIGEALFKRVIKMGGFGARALTFFLALAIIAALSFIPVLNFILWTIVFSIGLGAWSFALFTKREDQASVTP